MLFQCKVNTEWLFAVKDEDHNGESKTKSPYKSLKHNMMFNVNTDIANLCSDVVYFSFVVMLFLVNSSFACIRSATITLKL